MALFLSNTANSAWHLASDAPPDHWVTIGGEHIPIMTPSGGAATSPPSIDSLIKEHDAKDMPNADRRADVEAKGLNWRKYKDARFASGTEAHARSEKFNDAALKTRNEEVVAKAKADAIATKERIEATKKSRADAELKEKQEHDAKVASEIEADKDITPDWNVYHQVMNRIPEHAEFKDAQRYRDMGDVVAYKGGAEKLEDLVNQHRQFMNTLGKDIWDKAGSRGKMTPAQSKALAVSVAKAAVKARRAGVNVSENWSRYFLSRTAEEAWNLAWSDEARAAALEARKANYAGKESTAHESATKSYERSALANEAGTKEGHAMAAQGHRDAAGDHAAAGKAAAAAGDKDAASFHAEMAKSHMADAKGHDLRATANSGGAGASKAASGRANTASAKANKSESPKEHAEAARLHSKAAGEARKSGYNNLAAAHDQHAQAHIWRGAALKNKS